MAQKMSKKKKAAAVVAGALAVALALGGAYAWTDYSQSARNTFRGTVAEDVLLHDDFNGQNKDVYVENTGDGAAYVRVKFAEYLQIGNMSILPAYGEDAAVEGYKKADPEDVTTWPVHQFANANDSEQINICNGNAVDSHTYFEWKMTGAQKAYLAGVTEADPNGRGGMTQEAFEALTPGVDFTLGSITTHKNSTLPEQSVMMLSDYLLLLPTEQDALACWLLDTDGWAYWSQALATDTATNLLLDEVTVKDNSAPHDNAIYHIDVQLQAASLNEMDNWYANGNDVEVANPDNSIATTTLNGYNFIQLVAGNYIESADGLFTGENGKRYMAIAPNVYREVEMSGSGFVGIEGTEVVAGDDLLPGTDDDNMLSGRSAEMGGEVELDISGIDFVNNTYTIKGADADYVVTAGIDKLIGTYDDVITSLSGALGTYEIDGDDTNGKETVGWNYLGGPIDNMLITTEYALDTVRYNSTVDKGNLYVNSDIKATYETIGNSMGITAPIKRNITLDMSDAQHRGFVYACQVHEEGSEVHPIPCNTYELTEFYTNNSSKGQADIEGVTFFALSLNELFSAYGEDLRIDDVRRNIMALNAPAYENRQINSNQLRDGDGNFVNVVGYWLRSPGQDSQCAARVNIYGNASLLSKVSANDYAARPACYLDLSSASSAS